MMESLLARLGRMEQFAALHHRGFRLLWIATLLSSTARWADLVVVGWLTLELTDSPLMVGIVAAAKMAAYLVAPFTGVVADRMDRRVLLIAAAAVSLVVSAAMLFLILLDALALWHVIVLSLAGGLTWALDNPTRQAYLPDLVGPKALTNAIALNAVAIEITVVAGPALGGILIPTLGMSGAYLLITAICLLDVVVLLMLKEVKQTGPKVQESPLKSLIAGLRYVRGNQVALVLLVMALLLNLFAAPYRYTFLPLFARYQLDAGAAGYGLLTAMAGIGALIAGLVIVALGNFRNKGRLLLWSGFLWPVTLLLFSLSGWFTVSAALIFFAGLTQSITWTVIAALMLANTDQAMRGRVMGLRTGVVAALPLGNFLAGALAERFGAPLSQGAYAVAAILTMLAIIVVVPGVHRME